jgi:hypothetical protein
MKQWLVLSAWALAAPIGAAHAQNSGFLPGYTDAPRLATQLTELGRRPNVKLQSLAKTLGGRDVWVLTVFLGDPDAKPALLVVGNVQGPDLAGGEITLRLARKLASGDPEANKVLERFTVHLIPRPNPDASEAFFIKPHVERSVNARPVDDDHDGKTDEDGPDDLNGDGLITMMRIADPSGAWIAHSDDPRVMIQADADKGERGRYRLIAEGLDNDKDEQFDEDGPGGVDFNRNFTFEYPYLKPGAGPNQISEIETRAVADFIFDHPRIAVVFCFSPQDNLMHPWKPASGGGNQRIKTSVLGPDAPVFGHTAETYQKTHGGKDAPASAGAEGDLVHWAYYHFGRWSFGARAWWVPKPAAAQSKPAEETPPKKKGPAKKGGSEARSGDGRAAESLAALRWFDAAKIDAFVPWTRVDHPDFPGKAVEVGGFKPFVLLNPPAADLDGLADRHMKFLAELAAMMPRLAIAESKVQPLGGGVYRVTIRVANEGYLPTMPQMGKVNGIPRPLQAHLQPPEGATFIQGHARRLIDPLPGSGGSQELVWLLRSSPGAASLRVECPTIDPITHTVNLP